MRLPTQVVSRLIAIICATICATVVSAPAKEGALQDCTTFDGGRVVRGNLAIGIMLGQNNACRKKRADEIRARDTENRIQLQKLVDMNVRSMSARKDTRETTVALNNIASACRAVARHNKAELLNQRAGEVFQFELGPTTPPPGLLAIGKWMIEQGGAIAHWLGEIYKGKKLHEPINMILLDAGATSAAGARARLVAAATAAGYAVRFGHSSGYRGFIGGMFYDQLPAGFDDAFSNGIFEETNNHGRVFGPHRFGELYVFIAAFSRERVNFLEWPSHRYASFIQARDDFARHLDEKSVFKTAGFVHLDNAIVDDPKITTGDHDGCAVVLRAGNDKWERIGRQ